MASRPRKSAAYATHCGFWLPRPGRHERESFGPKLLKAVRQRMVDAGLCRTTINTGIGRIRRMFRWAVAEELVPATVLIASASRPGSAGRSLQCVEPTVGQPGFSSSHRRHQAVCVDTRLGRWSQLQLLTGMRSGEVLAMRGGDINMLGRRLGVSARQSHKTQHHGKGRIVFLGPQAQAIVKQLLHRPSESVTCSTHATPSIQWSRRRRIRRDAYRRAIEPRLRACFRHAALSCVIPDAGLSKLPEDERADGTQTATESSGRMAPRTLLVSASTAAFSGDDHPARSGS